MPEGEVAHQRNASGQFVKGHTINAGRHRKDILAVMRQAVLDEVAPEELALIIRKQAEKAMRGDIKSAIFIRDTVIGKPIRQVEENDDRGKLVELADLIKAAGN